MINAERIGSDSNADMTPNFNTPKIVNQIPISNDMKIVTAT